MKIKRAI